MASSEPTADAIETVLSTVFLTSDRAYKMLKPVKTSFVDFSNRETRLAATSREFELNHRISPEVYLGISDVVEHGHVADRMIVMERLPASRQLDRLVDDHDFAHQILRVARLIAAFHASQPPLTGTAAEPAGVDALLRNWSDNFEVLAPFAGSLIPNPEFRTVKKLAEGFLHGRRPLFDERIRSGMVRDGHGDLRAEHVFCLDDGPRLIDCLAFRDDFRIADVLNDVAFLAMDIHRLAGPAMAKMFVERYDEFFNEHHPAALAHHYVAYRAHVRAKVAAIRFTQGDQQAAAEVTKYHRMACEHLEVGQPRLIMVGGGAGVGKSTVAAGLADRIGATWLRSDEIRKQLAGLRSEDHIFSDPGSGLYASRFTKATYRELVRQAELLVSHGQTVVLDASWADEKQRELVRACGERTGTTVVELKCDAPLSMARERIARRMASVYNPSDATPEIADHIAAGFDPWPVAMLVDTTRSIAESLDHAYGHVMGQHTTRGRSNQAEMVIGREELSTESIGFFLSRVTRLGTGEFLVRR